MRTGHRAVARAGECRGETSVERTDTQLSHKYAVREHYARVSSQQMLYESQNTGQFVKAHLQNMRNLRRGELRNCEQHKDSLRVEHSLLFVQQASRECS